MQVWGLVQERPLRHGPPKGGVGRGSCELQRYSRLVCLDDGRGALRRNDVLTQWPLCVSPSMRRLPLPAPEPEVFDLGDAKQMLLKPVTTITHEPDGTMRVRQSLDTSFTPSDPAAGPATYTRLVTDVKIDESRFGMVDLSQHLDSTDAISCGSTDQFDLIGIDVEPANPLVFLLEPSNHDAPELILSGPPTWECAGQPIFRSVLPLPSLWYGCRGGQRGGVRCVRPPSRRPAPLPPPVFCPFPAAALPVKCAQGSGHSGVRWGLCSSRVLGGGGGQGLHTRAQTNKQRSGQRHACGAPHEGPCDDPRCSSRDRAQTAPVAAPLMCGPMQSGGVGRDLL